MATRPNNIYASSLNRRDKRWRSKRHRRVFVVGSVSRRAGAFAAAVSVTAAVVLERLPG